MSVEAFLQFSQAVTGFTDLSLGQAEALLRMIETKHEGEHLDDLLAAFQNIFAAGGEWEAQIKTKIIDDPKLGSLAQLIILAWYLGEVYSADQPTPDKPASRPETFYQGLFWTAVHAHPPTLSGGYFGHWTYPPDN